MPLAGPCKAILRVASSEVMMDYDLGLFDATATVTVPYFRHTPVVTPIQPGQTITSPLLDSTDWRTDSVYYSLTLPAGDYTISLDISRPDGTQGALSGFLSTLNADGTTTRNLGSIIELNSRAARSFGLPLSEEQFLIVRVKGEKVQALMRIDPRRDE